MLVSGGWLQGLSNNNKVKVRVRVSERWMAVGVLCRGTDRERLQLAFQLFDQDRNNTLGQPELIQMLAVLPESVEYSQSSGVFAIPFSEKLEIWEARTATVLTRLVMLMLEEHLIPCSYITLK